MKKPTIARLTAILIMCCELLSIRCYAQPQLWGMTQAGGQDNLGIIFKTDSTANSLTVKQSFLVSYPGATPQYTDLIQASDGMLYGMTYQGGANNVGVIFQYDPATNIYTKKIDLSTANGSNPYGSLMQATDGMLYGMTYNGGANNVGVIFQYNPSNNIFTKKIDLSAANGSSPYGSLMQATDGMIYGMTSQGGASNYGVLFQYAPSTNTYIKKIDLSYSSGYAPQGTLMQATDGMLYGTIANGGANGYGVLFQYAPSTNTYTTKIDFSTATGFSHKGSLMQATDGQLYGMAQSGGASGAGVIFQYAPSTNTYTIKIDLSTANGSYPTGSLIQATDGMLYGMTTNGGANLAGTLFQYAPSTNTYIKKFDFNGAANGSIPQGSLMQASDGKIYGMTTQGGAIGVGVIFQYTPSTNTYTRKIDFSGALDGSNPYGSLMQASDGQFYGMTINGGANSVGTIFQYNPGTNTYTKKIDLSAANGSNPRGALIQASDGMLYGMTSSGGTNNVGVIFQYNPATNIYTKKLDFDVNNGQSPYGSLMQASDGMLYGMTPLGGANGVGVLFQYNTATNTYTNKLDFDLINGLYPFGSLIQAFDGKLYGMTTYTHINGGYGVIFQYDPVTSTYTKKISFSPANGVNPTGSLMQAPDGKLYGMTQNGGANGVGVLFQYTPSTNTYTKKIDFNGAANGSSPQGSLMQASDWKLYGMTNSGGTNSSGVLFQYNTNTNTYTKKLDFNGTNGKNPYYSNLIDIAVSLATTAVTTSNCAGSSITVPFINTGLYNAGNVFSAQLSDASGSFASPTTIGTISSTGASGTINAVIPSNTPLGTVYKIRVVSSSPAVTGSDNGSNISINPTLTVTATANPSSAVCTGTSVTLIGGGAINYVWTGGITDGTSFVPTSTATYTVTGMDGNGCTNTITKTITVNPLPLVFAFATSTTVCAGTSITLSGVGNAISYAWTGGVTDGVAFTPSSTIPYTVTGTDANGCTGIATKTITVLPGAGSSQSPTICAGDSVTVGGNTYTVSGTYTDVFTAYNGCDSTVTTNLTVNDISASIVNSTFVANASGASYQWLNCGTGYSSIAGQIYQNFTPAVGGSYAVIVTKNGCSDTSACYISTTGIFENSFAKTINIYPNPFTTQTTISFDHEQKNILLKIMDVLGKEIKTINFTGKQLIVEKSEMKAGIYFVQIYTEQGVASKKIIIN
ncbi:MAG: choice-of-anchor tandem repeat GloVer-containing protein [Bacteroidota bacterium]